MALQPRDCGPRRLRLQTGSLNSTAPTPPPSPVWLHFIPDLAWAAFLVWTGVGFIVMPLGVGEADVRGWLGNRSLQDAAVALLHTADAVWIVLAAVVVYLHAAAAEGLSTARRWALIILVSSTIFEWVGTATGFPFGPYRYTDHFGWRIAGVVPLAIPLAWFVVLLCGRSVVLRLYAAATRLELALGMALIAVLTDLNLEYVAWKVRAYWVWYPQSHTAPPAWPPLQNYVAWFMLSFALGFVLPASHELRPQRPSPRRPILVLGLMNALLAFVHLVR